jgi:hypothetical protein
MSASAKNVFATLLLAILIASPAEACADSMKLAGTPAHPCCPAKPAPLMGDCARPGCIYMDTSIVPVAVTAMNDAAGVCELVLSVAGTENQPTPGMFRVRPLALLTPYQRFLVFHQFLI